MESLLIAALRQDSGDHVFKYLAPRNLARLEQCLTSKLVFVPAGEGDALLHMVAARQHVEAAKKGATMLVPLGDGREGRITWTMELRWIRMAVARLRVGGAKKLISAGRSHSLVTSGKEAEIWSFGHGGWGMLGHGCVENGGAENEAVPRLIEALNRVAVKQVSAGEDQSMVLSSEGLVWTWGHWVNGRLGHARQHDIQRVPKQVEDLTDVTYIAAGSSHSLVVGEGGVVYTWGRNYPGQLGLGDHGACTDRRVPTLVDDVNGVVAVAAGTFHSLALSRDGTVMACGWNLHGQLGLGDTAQRDTFTVVAGLSDVVDIDVGDKHTIAVTCEGEVWTWGRGPATGHGVDDEIAQWLVPTKVTGAGIDEAMVVQVTAGQGHSLALTATGEFYSWGKGTDGQLGHGDKENLAVPRVVGGIGGAVVGMSGGTCHSLAITQEGRVLAFGGGGEWDVGEWCDVGARGGGVGGSGTDGDRWDHRGRGRGREGGERVKVRRT
jgi:alpha-tubulin suppressor-like RCC1 family protein